MSKSDPSDNSRINLTDDADTIARKVRRAKSDSEMGLSFEPERRPEAANLLNIYAALAEEPREAVVERFAASSFSDFKSSSPISRSPSSRRSRGEMRRLLADPGDIDAILRAGAERAEAIASDNLAQVYDIVGFLRR